MASLKRYQHYIGGEWVDPASGEWLESFNPYTGQPWAEFPRGDAADADRAVAAAHKAFTSGDWPSMGPTARGALMRKLGDLIAANAQELAQTEVQDNGKLIAEMGAQLGYIPQWYYYYGGLADKIEGSVLPIDKPETFNYTLHEPLGVCVAITPWNSPLLITAWKLAPALAAGNTVVLKPSEFTSASAFEFVKLVEEAGFPPGVVNVVSGYGKEIGEALVSHDKVAKVSFTGGTQSGTRVYENAAGGLKKVSLELGGKSPNIVFDDCEIENAVKGVISGIFAATGQTCIAGSRLLVQESIHNEFVDKLVTFAKTAQMGDPMSLDTQVGPVTTPPQYEKILSYFDVAKEDGAECALGGGKPDDPALSDGWFVQPTIYTGVDNSMRIAQEEIFGPVLSVIPFKDDDHAVEIANDVVYGLASGIWTQSIRRALNISKRIQSGTVWVNTYRAVSFVSPFGGYKRSGLGKESGQEAIREYMQTKSVWISTAAEVPNPFVIR
ncbi:MAG TPA: carnitine dehydratase [Rhodospirillaceae bacterium]|nr:carnitine dehydratase [Rhodospirillaceae bacterium]HAA93377.1 carnitine dehydratase [Rhodospirillaceae bacterium]HAT36288.1 carnitine dehydratase [Rhodospirillaceae bacterium]